MQSYRFQIATGAKKSCSWINQKDIKPYQRRNRLNKWCRPNTPSGRNCRFSCGLCRGFPTPNPVPAPKPFNCEPPSLTFKFRIATGEMKGCSWINEPGIKSYQRQNRRNKWCRPNTPSGRNCRCSCLGGAPAPNPAPAPTRPSPSPPSTGISNDMRTMLNLINRDRAKVGADPLCFNAKLNTAARTHSFDMRQKQFFSHTGSDKSSLVQRVKNVRFNYDTVGENISTDWSITRAHKELMLSKGHRENIEWPDYTHIGIGITTYVKNTNYDFAGNYIITQVFGSVTTGAREQCIS